MAGIQNGDCEHSFVIIISLEWEGTRCSLPFFNRKEFLAWQTILFYLLLLSYLECFSSQLFLMRTRWSSPSSIQFIIPTLLVNWSASLSLLNTECSKPMNSQQKSLPSLEITSL